jgi:hypothetical protein
MNNRTPSLQLHVVLLTEVLAMFAHFCCKEMTGEMKTHAL